MLDISFTGGSVLIENPLIGKTGLEISEFSEDGSPVEVDEIEVAGHGITMNGTVVRWRKPSAFTAKVTVIPQSDADVSLSKLLINSHVQPNGQGVIAADVEKLVCKMTIKAPQINKSGGTSEHSAKTVVNTWVFSEGFMVSGSPAVTSDAEGKMQSKTFSFVFERMAKFDANGLALKAGTSSLGA